MEEGKKMGMKLQKKKKEINLYLLVAFVIVISFVTQRLQSKNDRRRIAPFTFSRINSGYDINICMKKQFAYRSRVPQRKRLIR